VADAGIYDINDVIEYDNDGVVRTVTDVNITAAIVTFANDALSSNSADDTRVYNWGPNVTDMNEDSHLTVLSPCIDTGDPNFTPASGETDIDGQTRVMRGTVDMGADEFPRVHNTTQDQWYVDIQDAIDDANNNDTIKAYPGTYYERVDFNGVNCTLTGTDPNDWDVVESTIIDANGGILTSAVLLDANEDSAFVTGLTLQNAFYGIKCDSADATVSKCLIKENTFGFYCYSASPAITECIVKDNTSSGLWLQSGSPVISRNTIENNGTGISATATGTIKNNWIYGGSYGITVASAATIRNNTITNTSLKGIYKPFGSAPTISNCIIWNCNDDLSGCSATYSCISDCNDANGTGNICGDANDPNFLDVDANDFHLKATSPCINTADPNFTDAYEVDFDGEGRIMSGTVDMGADEAEKVRCWHYKCSTNWTIQTNTDWSIYTPGDGKADFYGTYDTSGYIKQDVSVEAGKYYTVVIKVDKMDYDGDWEADLQVRLGNTLIACWVATPGDDDGAVGTHTFTNVQATNTDELRINAVVDFMWEEESTLDVNIDYVSVIKEH